MTNAAHLVRRFFGSIYARRPGPDDQRFIAAQLTSRESEIFWQQPVADLRHALRSGRFIVERAPERADLIRAALLHDVGKRHAGIGTLRRSIATALQAVHLPVGRRSRTYLDHADIGANELAELGCEETVIAFARHHHGSPSTGFDPSDWALLLGADGE